MIIDAHCHIDAYPDPIEIVQEIGKRRILTVGVTNSPSDFVAAYPHVRRCRWVRLALGLHPLLGDNHPAERARFAAQLSRTSYVGEIGLDFSPAGLPTREAQLLSFRHVLNQLRDQRKFASIHSRRAEEHVLDILEELDMWPVVFHWYSGPKSQMDRLLRLGHYCSVNPAMLTASRGRRLLEQIPPDRILTETDGPFARVNGSILHPGEIGDVVGFLAATWSIHPQDVRDRIEQNFRSLFPSAVQRR